MRVCYGLLALALGACSTPAETSWSAGDPQELRIEEEDSEEAELEEAEGPQLAHYLCFRIDSESGLEDYVPTIRATLSLVAHRWGWPILISDECESFVTVESLERTVDLDPAAHTTSLEVAEGTYLSGAYVGGATRIALDLEHLETGKLTDFSACLDGESFYLLTTVLTHELGHMLGVEHSEDEHSVMFRQAEECLDVFPTEQEFQAAVR